MGIWQMRKVEDVYVFKHASSEWEGSCVLLTCSLLYDYKQLYAIAR